MKHLASRLWLALLLPLLLVAPILAQATGPIVVLEIDGVINPLTAQYLDRSLRQAEQRGARLVVVTLDTPGGLESSMREMTQALLESPTPTVVFVTPGGARATSAGLFITLAGHIAAMTPGTHLGAAHPVPLGAEIDEVMSEKATSDAAALVRAIAERRGRNAEWPERAVRENLSLTASEALSEGIIDLLASDLTDLLRQLDGRTVTTAAGAIELRTAGAPVESQPMTFPERLMHAITDPNIAYLLLSLGTLLLLAELVSPGLSIAGIGSAVSFILALMALGNLPVNWAGIALLALAAVLFLVGLLTDTEAIVTLGGLVPFVLGSLLLFSPFRPSSPAAPDLRVSLWLIGLVAGAILLFTLGILRAVLKAGRLPPQSGAERLVGRLGVAYTDLAPSGQVRVGTEEWSAVALEGTVRAGQEVRVVGVAGVRLQVVPVEAGEKG